jgi:hypothetical protein
MRRAFSLAVVILLPAAALAVMTLLIDQPGLPAEAQPTLDQYLQHAGLGAASVVVQQVRHAARPGQFTASLSAATVGESSYFQLSRNDQPPATQSGYIWDQPVITYSLRITAVPVASLGQVPLPYPPADLWCVLLSSPSAAAPQSIFLARHEDLYAGAWLVQELPPGLSRSALARVWSTVGCAVDWAP